MRHSLVTQYSDATPERLRRSEGYFDIGGGGRRGPVQIITVRDDPLSRLLANGSIDWRQYSAAQKFLHHFNAIGGLKSSDLMAVRAGFFSREPDSHHFYQYQRAVKALGELEPTVHAIVVVGVKLHQRAVQEGLSDNGRGVAQIKAVLSKGLDILADLWG
jgi:hypothetical protein